MKLYELSEQFKNLEALLEREDLPKEDILKALEDVEGNINEKLEGMCKFIKSIESDVTGIETEEKRLSAMKSTKKNSITSIKEYMLQQMKGLKMENVKTPLFNIRLQLSNPSVNVLDEKKIPKKYFIRQAPILDKRTLLEDLKTDKKIKGCEILRKEGVRIK